MLILIILFFIIGAVAGWVIASLLASNKLDSIVSGKLIIADSDEAGEKPYIFLELSEPVDSVEKKELVHLQVSHK